MGAFKVYNPQSAQWELVPVGVPGYAGSLGYTGSTGAGFVGSRGDLGYTGSIGYTGSQGVIGYTGSRGDLGYTGSIGYTGSQGVIGYTGSQGVVGYTGSKGDLGYTGSQGVGFTGSIGPSTMPINNQTASYIAANTDNGGIISITTGGVTINTGIFSNGQNVSIYNNSGSNQTITQGAGVTMYLAGTATTGNRTIVQRGLCSVFCIDSTTSTFVIAGSGLL